MLRKDESADTHWVQLNDLFHAALGREPGDVDAFLKRACSGNDELRREVESLLRYSGRELQLTAAASGSSSDTLANGLPDRAPSLDIGATLGSHRILGRLGAGGMGEVYRALDLKLQREVAIKVMPPHLAADPDRASRFAREAKVLASLNHPSIGAIYGLEESGTTRALILELVEGPTLADRIAKGPLPMHEALAVAAQIIEAMDYAHEKGIIHRDLKPSNVKITPEGKVKVLDFGLAEGLSPDPRHPDDAAPGVLLGTPAYMAPEQARGKPVDRRADIWSFGALFFEMLTGRRLFEGKTILDTLGLVISADPDWGSLPAGTPPGVRRLLELCLQKDPRLRLRNIGDASFIMASTSLPAVTRTSQTAAWLPIAVSGVAIAVLVVALIGSYRSKPGSRVVRLNLAPPEGVTLLTQAVSPDGRLLTFTARDSDGNVALWLRPLDRETAEKLPGTAGAYYPFWSSDSRYIGFFSDNLLKRVEAAGGPAQTVYAVGASRGGAWAPNGLILFSKATDGIYAVPAAGGEAKSLTALAPDQKEAGHYWPSLLPDGKHFLYTSLSGVENVRGVWAAEIARPANRRRLIGDQSQAIYASGYLLFVRDGLLTAQRLDPRALRLQGEPVPVMEGVTSSLGVSSGAAPFSASETGVMVVGGGVAGAEQSRLTWLDRSGRRLGTVGAMAPYLRLMLSPDRRRVVADLPDSNRALDLFVFDLGRLSSTRVTFDPAFDTGPVWSPRGDRIAFTSNRNGTYDLYAAQANGAGDGELLLHTERNKHATDWSRDGRSILYVDYLSRGNTDVWVLDLPSGTTTPYLRTEFEESTARFSPDGRWVAYTSKESGRSQVYVQSFPASTGKWQISTGGGDRICWRPDGRELFYITPDAKLAAVEISAGRVFAAGAPKMLFDTHLRIGAVSYDVSSDGRQFLMPQPVQTADSDPVTIILNWPAGLRPH